MHRWYWEIVQRCTLDGDIVTTCPSELDQGGWDLVDSARDGLKGALDGGNWYWSLVSIYGDTSAFLAHGDRWCRVRHGDLRKSSGA